VRAGDEERRRLERNLHDGAQQRLVSLSLTLRLAAKRHHEDPMLLGAVEELSHALEELRELARGIHPAVLTELGLVPALRTLVRRSPVPCALLYEGEERMPLPIEATAYFLAAEALTNIARHAQASRAEISVELDDGTLTLTIRDDGAGGATAGSGLRGMEDRLAAVGGQLEVLSPQGSGTIVRGVMPCGS
jgi:signal transduction histidine kinase